MRARERFVTLFVVAYYLEKKKNISAPFLRENQFQRDKIPQSVLYYLKIQYIDTPQRLNYKTSESVGRSRVP